MLNDLSKATRAASRPRPGMLQKLRDFRAFSLRQPDQWDLVASLIHA